MHTPSSTPESPTVTPYTPDEQEIIDSLIACQKELGVSDEKFADQYLKSHSATTWNRLRRADYGAQNRTKVMGEMKTALASIRRRIQRLKKSTQGSHYYEFDLFSAMFRAVEECLVKRGQNRLIFYIAKTGEGKSRFIAELATRQTVTEVTANEAWFGSYYFAALDILEALEVPGKFASAAEARRQVLANMRGRAQVLAIDEGNYFGPRSINLIKDILNETEWTVFVGCTPTFWAKMQRFYGEWSQLQRRIHTVFKHVAITAKDAAEFLRDAGLNGDAAKSGVVLSKAANEFGGYDFVQRVMERLHEANHDHPALDDVTKAIAFVNAQLDRVQ